MAAENSSVIRILKLYELLRQETDENHQMLATTVCKKLVDQGIPCDRRTLSRCVNKLNDYGYEVMGRLVGHEKGYYVMDRAFSVPELKVLIDAVHAAQVSLQKRRRQCCGLLRHPFLRGVPLPRTERNLTVNINRDYIIRIFERKKSRQMGTASKKHNIW